MKKIITHFTVWGGNSHFLLTVCFLLGLFILQPGVMRAWETNDTFQYEIEDNEVTILGFANGITKSELDIPAEIDGKSVVKISYSAFSSQNFTRVSIPASVKEIGRLAFEYCQNLTTVEIANNSQLETIGNYAFRSTAITSFTIPATVKTIGNNAFYQTAITSINIPASVTTIGESAFYSKNLSTVNFAENSQLETIGKKAFAGTAITSITIPAKVKILNSETFFNCQKLSTINFADNSQLETIDNYAFSKAAITSIKIPASVKTIGQRAFYDCKNLSTVSFAENSQLESINWEAFDGAAINSIEIPASVKTIGDQAFMSCPLQSVIIPEGASLETIGNSAFYNTNIKSIKIPASVKTIGTYAFYNCQNLSTVTMAENSNLETIDQNAFTGTAITSINIPASVKTIGSYAFYNCQNLSTVTMATGASLETIGREAFDNTLIESINIPASVKTIGISAFNNCQSLSAVSFAEGSILEDIDSYAFSNTSIASIKIPASVKVLHENAFYSNKNLKTIQLLGNEASIDDNAFYNLTNLKYILVNSDGYNSYKAQAFSKKVKLVDNVIEGDVKTVEEIAKQSKGFHSYYAGQLTYQRNVDATDEYATLCLPYDIDLSNTDGVFKEVLVPTGRMIHKTNDKEHTSFILKLNKQESNVVIPANTPMLVKLAEGKNEFSISSTEGVVIDGTLANVKMTVYDWDGSSEAMTENTDFSISYGSSYEDINTAEKQGLWTFNGDGTFGPQKNGILKPFRLFLTVSVPASLAKTFSISTDTSDGATTGINEIGASDSSMSSDNNASSDHVGIIYDLNGRKVANNANIKSLHKGIYIQNGKKFVIK